ncbi:hypothetical protein VARIO8X_90684 [Burkholderiales bacterium 8X]|nr:hypothetical protein VARIO8X_90684 [Burkholderiales bacterium 8X]
MASWRRGARRNIRLYTSKIFSKISFQEVLHARFQEVQQRQAPEAQHPVAAFQAQALLPFHRRRRQEDRLQGHRHAA